MTGNVAAPQIALEEKKRAVKKVFGGSLAESVTAGATIVLSLIALSGIMRDIMLPIAVLTMGAAFLLEGGAVSMRLFRLLAEASEERVERADFGIGVTSELLGGVTGLVLGILSLLHIAPMVLLPVAVIVYGATLIFSSGMTIRLNAVELESIAGTTERFRKIAHEITTAAAGVEFLFGLSALILGIIGLTGSYTITLSLVATLLVGISGFVTGAAVTARMAGFFRSESV